MTEDKTSKREAFCETCRFWYREDPLVKSAKDPDDDSDIPGRCQRFPPVYVAMPRDDCDYNESTRLCFSFIYWQQPATQWDNWCGEYRPIHPARPDQCNLPISELNLSVRAQWCAECLKCETIGDLASQTRHSILSVRNIGKTTFQEIKNRLAERGLTLEDIG